MHDEVEATLAQSCGPCILHICVLGRFLDHLLPREASPQQAALRGQLTSARVVAFTHRKCTLQKCQNLSRGFCWAHLSFTCRGCWGHWSHHTYYELAGESRSKLLPTATFVADRETDYAAFSSSSKAIQCLLRLNEGSAEEEAPERSMPRPL